MFTDFLNSHSLMLLRQSERDGLYSPWMGEFDCSKPSEPFPIIIRCARCGEDIFDSTILDTREQKIRLWSKENLFEDFHIARIFVPIRDHTPLEVYSCEPCACEVRNPKNFERVKFAAICWGVRAGIGVGLPEAHLKSEVEMMENMGLDYAQLHIVKEN